MTKDLSKKTLIVLMIIALVISTVGMLNVLQSRQTISAGESLTEGKLKMNIVNENEIQETESISVSNADSS